MELCSAGTQCTIDPQFYCSRCQEGSGRVRRGFLSWGPNLDDFFHRVAIVSVCSFANVPQWTMTFKCRLNSLSFSSFFHLVDWHWDLWNLFACTFPFEASRVWSLTCCGTLFWASSQHAPLSASVLFPWTFSWPEFQCFLISFSGRVKPESSYGNQITQRMWTSLGRGHWALLCFCYCSDKSTSPF